MGQQRLTGLVLLNIHRNIEVKAQATINRFTYENKRFILL